MTIDELMAMPVKSNYHNDSEVWDAAHEVAADTRRPIAERLKALEKMNDLTGEDDPCDELALQEYLVDAS